MNAFRTWLAGRIEALAELIRPTEQKPILTYAELIKGGLFSIGAAVDTLERGDLVQVLNGVVTRVQPRAPSTT